MFNAASTVAVAATISGSSSRHQHRNILPPLAISSDTTNANLYRHSNHSSDSDSQASPITALDSSAALILVHDEDEDDSEDQFNFTDDDDEDRGDGDEIVSPLFEVRRLPAFPPLPPVRVFLYLVSPYLKLGALNLPYSNLPLKYGLPALLLCALASVFARQIWYMLARYLRKADMADILCDTFARGRGKEGRRAYIRSAAKVGTGLLALLVAVTYLRCAIYTLFPLLPNNHHRKTTYLILTAGIGIIVAWLSYAISLNSRRVVYSTWLSILTYLAWMGCLIYAHGHGVLKAQPGWLGAGSFWQGLATTAFAFCSSSTLPLYASLKTTSHPIISTGKPPRARSFRLLSLTSVVLAVLCLLPSVIFSSFPNHPATSALSSSTQSPHAHKTLIALNYAEVDEFLKAPLPPVLGTSHQLTPPLPDMTLPDLQLHIDSLLAALSAASLLFGIPSVMVTAPSIAVPSFRLAKFNVSRVLSIVIVLALALIPPDVYPRAEKPVGGTGDETPVPTIYPYSQSSKYVLVLTAITLIAAFASTYLLPSFIHIFTHVFKRPVAIVVPPPQTPLLHTHMSNSSPSGSPTADHNRSSSGRRHSRSGSSSNGSPRTIHDELLLRKERALQRRQFRRRIVWDVGVWVLFGTSGFGVAVLICGFVGVL